MGKGILQVIITSFLLISSCVHDFDPKGPEMSMGDLVVNGILFKDSLPKVYLHRSKWFDAPGHPELVDDAEVWIHSKMIGAEDDMLKSQLLVFKDSIYAGNTKLEAGMEYFLEVETKEGAKITANTIVPHPQKILATKMIAPAGIMETPTRSGSFTRFSMEFIRSFGHTFFETFIFNKDTASPEDPKKPYQILRTLNRDEIILKESLPGNYLYSFVFSANNVPRDMVSLQFDYIGTANPFFTQFYIVLQSCSEEYFLYKKSLYDHLDALQFQENFSTDDLYFPNIFRSVNPVYSNIRGGRGIFAGLGMDIAETVCNLVGNTCE